MTADQQGGQGKGEGIQGWTAATAGLSITEGWRKYSGTLPQFGKLPINFTTISLQCDMACSGGCAETLSGSGTAVVKCLRSRLATAQNDNTEFQQDVP